jgi:hypothetical protein
VISNVERAIVTAQVVFRTYPHLLFHDVIVGLFVPLQFG